MLNSRKPSILESKTPKQQYFSSLSKTFIDTQKLASKNQTPDKNTAETFKRMIWKQKKNLEKIPKKEEIKEVS